MALPALCHIQTTNKEYRMNNKQISVSDLNEQLIDTLNGMNAVITELAKRAGVSDQDLKTIRFQASAGYQRVRAKMEQENANRQAFEEDRTAMTAWNVDARFLFADAKEWAKAADVEWLVICERNGSEHNRPHPFVYREPSQAELLAALKEYGGWANADEQKYAGHRARARKALPHIKKKLAALLVA